jgi:hypothetical protein
MVRFGINSRRVFTKANEAQSHMVMTPSVASRLQIIVWGLIQGA